MRFRKRVRLFPGVSLNISGSGISTTIGIPGASINISKKGTYLNTGIPGTGIYDRQKIGPGRSKRTEPYPKEQDSEKEAIPSTQGQIKSQSGESTTSKGLESLKRTLVGCFEERNSLENEIKKAQTDLGVAVLILTLSYLTLLGFFFKGFKNRRYQLEEELKELKSLLKDCQINIDMQLSDQFEESYQGLQIAFKELSKSQKIWDITSAIPNDRETTRSAADSSITRTVVSLNYKNIEIIKSKYDAMHFQNANGGDLYFYPGFLAIVDSKKKFGLIDLREIQFSFREQHFLEQEQIPSDGEVVGKSWAKVNKNGTPDKRFKDNYEIPICQYGEIELKSDSGLFEVYSVSNFERARSFSSMFLEYQNLLSKSL